LHQQAEQRWRELACGHNSFAGEARRDIVERFARDETDPTDATVRPSRYDQLNDRAAGVVANQRYIGKVEAVDEFSDKSGEA
jgi:hypothetical protein